MDPLSVGAGVIAVASAGFDVTRLLFDLVDKTESQSKQIESVGTEISFLSCTLDGLAEMLKSEQSLYSNELLQATDQITAQCKVLFEEIIGLIEAVTDGSVRTRDRRRWPFGEIQIITLTSRLNSLKSTTSLMLQTLKFAMKKKRRTLDLTMSVATNLLRKQDAQERGYLWLLIEANRRMIERLQSLEDDERDARTQQNRLPTVGNGVSQLSRRDQNMGHEVPTTSTALIRILPYPYSNGDSNRLLGHNSLNTVNSSSGDTAHSRELVAIDSVLDRWTTVGPHSSAARHGQDRTTLGDGNAGDGTEPYDYVRGSGDGDTSPEFVEDDYDTIESDSQIPRTTRHSREQLSLEWLNRNRPRTGREQPTNEEPFREQPASLDDGSEAFGGIRGMSRTSHCFSSSARDRESLRIPMLCRDAWVPLDASPLTTSVKYSSSSPYIRLRALALDPVPIIWSKGNDAELTCFIGPKILWHARLLPSRLHQESDSEVSFTSIGKDYVEEEALQLLRYPYDESPSGGHYNVRMNLSFYDIQRLVTISAKLFDQHLQQRSQLLQELREAAARSSTETENDGAEDENNEIVDERANEPVNENSNRSESDDGHIVPRTEDQDASNSHGQMPPADKIGFRDRLRAWLRI